MGAVIRASGLVKHYGDVVALDGLDLDVEEATVLGLLGPNGAGKTTAVRILTTLLQPDAGAVEVAGVDVLADPQSARERIGLSGQYAAVDEHLTGYENLEMIGRLYHLGLARARTRARELLVRFDLDEAGNRPVKTYSGGMRRRLDLAGALVAEPPVLFLDEPTTGLDPRSRINMWEVIRELLNDGTTLLLTTQYLEEADRLADDIIVIDHGRSIAHGTANALKAQVGGERIELVVAESDDLTRARDIATDVSVGDVLVDAHTNEVVAPVSGGPDDLMAVLRRLDAAGVRLLDVGLRRPTLDDVFLALTGHVAEPEPVDHESAGDIDADPGDRAEVVG
ncbi:MAG: ATP-binding cassette domain-containing protein [Nitriliruptoraceae bacterium]